MIPLLIYKYIAKIFAFIIKIFINNRNFTDRDINIKTVYKKFGEIDLAIFNKIILEIWKKLFFLMPELANITILLKTTSSTSNSEASTALFNILRSFSCFIRPLAYAIGGFFGILFLYFFFGAVNP